jgi:cell division protein FtsW (lipid II flippase)
MLLRWNHLPERHNDMIFTVICTRWGVVGAIGVWGLYLLFAIGGLLTAAMCRDPFGRLVAVGITTIILAQMAVNAGMTLGLFPITGMTLPFVSYGGSSLVVTWMMVGLMVGIARHRGGMNWREPFDFDKRGSRTP